jgi:hypothetical protein
VQLIYEKKTRGQKSRDTVSLRLKLYSMLVVYACLIKVYGIMHLEYMEIICLYVDVFNAMYVVHAKYMK